MTNKKLSSKFEILKSNDDEFGSLQLIVKEKNSRPMMYVDELTDGKKIEKGLHIISDIQDASLILRKSFST